MCVYSAESKLSSVFFVCVCVSNQEDSSQTESLRAPHTPDGTPPPLTSTDRVSTLINAHLRILSSDAIRQCVMMVSLFSDGNHSYVLVEKSFKFTMNDNLPLGILFLCSSIDNYFFIVL